MRSKPQNFASLELPDLSEKRNDAVVTETRTYKLITPLFGGGVTPDECDPVTVVSGKNVRGQLRFWWRATRGGAFDGDLAKMKAAEDELWGATAQKGKSERGQSKVAIEVVTLKSGKKFIVKQNNSRTKQPEEIQISDLKSPYGYVAFPLRERPNGAVSDGVEFSLTLRYDKLKLKKEQIEGIEAALWAWETFGGVGARTRRGFGALQLIEHSVDGQNISVPLASAHDVEAWLQKRLDKYVSSGKFPVQVPHLSSKASENLNVWLKIASPYPSAESAWRYLIEKLKEFRQSRNTGKERNHPGRSRWNEPEAIRMLTGQRLPRHLPPNSGKKNPVPNTPNFFPRAVFGLPIVFHFKDGNDKKPYSANLDPQKTILNINDKERLASPLILKPIPLKSTNGEIKYIGIGVILTGSQLQTSTQLILKSQDENQSWNRLYAINLNEAKKLKKHDGSLLLNGEADVLQAFLKSL